MKEKHGLLLFITSCLCGCGQMYQGYLKRGLSLLVLSALSIILSAFLLLDGLALFLPVIWLYAFFDSYDLRAKIAAGTPPQDAYLFGLSELDSQRLSALMRRRHSVVGWVLVAVGVWLLYERLVDTLGWYLGGWVYQILRYELPRAVVTVGIILLGLWFIRGPRRPKDDIPDFTPPDPGAGPAGPGGDGGDARQASAAADPWQAPGGTDSTGGTDGTQAWSMHAPSGEEVPHDGQ